ncbi:MAG TPA: hypothetical protein VJN41_01690, partial [Alphaproteobacteria bacterium]|nr:hypothetical protein [Alphaproteobacteria bacterium]
GQRFAILAGPAAGINVALQIAQVALQGLEAIHDRQKILALREGGARGKQEQKTTGEGKNGKGAHGGTSRS